MRHRTTHTDKQADIQTPVVQLVDLITALSEQKIRNMNGAQVETRPNLYLMSVNMKKKKKRNKAMRLIDGQIV